MRLIWSKSNSALSVLIRLITGEDCSHFSIVLYDGKPGEIMFESNLLGTHPAFFQTSLKSHKIIHDFKVPCSTEVEDMIWDKIVKIYDGRSYDFLGAIYLGWRKILYRIFHFKIPDINKWSNPSKYYCCELFEILNGLKDVPLIPKAQGMKTPHDFWEYFT